MKRKKRTGGGAIWTSAQLVPLVNAYTFRGNGPKDWQIQVPHASVLANLEEITVHGTLLPRELATIEPNAAKRHIRLGGNYSIEKNDGDLHFCVGTPRSPSSQGHIGCELQKATGWLPAFSKGINKPMAVTGFFRCLFEHPGFKGNADAHIFEIHPVRVVDSLNGKRQVFDIDIPAPSGIRHWEGKHVRANEWDAEMSVDYDKAKDTLTFRGMHGMDKNYVQVQGKISHVRAPSPTQPARFTFTSPEISRTLEGLCLPGSSAFHQLTGLKSTSSKVWLVALRNIDLDQAMKGSYRIKLLAIDIRDSAQGPAVPLAQLGSEK